jgi:hypothetical protein
MSKTHKKIRLITTVLSKGSLEVVMYIYCEGTATKHRIT